MPDPFNHPTSDTPLSFQLLLSDAPSLLNASSFSKPLSLLLHRQSFPQIHPISLFTVLTLGPNPLQLGPPVRQLTETAEHHMLIRQRGLGVSRHCWSLPSLTRLHAVFSLLILPTPPLPSPLIADGLTSFSAEATQRGLPQMPLPGLPTCQLLPNTWCHLPVTTDKPPGRPPGLSFPSPVSPSLPDHSLRI